VQIKIIPDDIVTIEKHIKTHIITSPQAQQKKQIKEKRCKQVQIFKTDKYDAPEF